MSTCEPLCRFLLEASILEASILATSPQYLSNGSLSDGESLAALKDRLIIGNILRHGIVVASVAGRESRWRQESTVQFRPACGFSPTNPGNGSIQ